MSTQHPDNVKQPFFVDNSVIGGDDEVKEAFYAFSHLRIKEQLWDCEGKEVDNFVVEKLLTKYPDFFSKHKLGKDFFITLRAPNPRIEKNKGKLLLDTLESIPRNYDIARHFYQEEIAPIFEVTIPMISNSNELLRIKNYYEEHIVKKQNSLCNDIKIKEWVGEFKPEKINVIPLIEDKDSMLRSDEIVKGYLDKIKKQEYQRVWLARSDPALNYGNLSAIFANRIAFQKLHGLEEESSVDIEPIIGCGSVPFRGNFKPGNIKNTLKVYPSVQTFTLQSAFKYDYPLAQVNKAVEILENTKRKKPLYIDEEKSLEIIEKVSLSYQSQVKLLSPILNQFSVFIPKRRKRKLHVGLFGYSREGSGVKLPRAIKFCASLYSFGLPPELLGLNSLNDKDWEFIYENTGVEKDIYDAIKYLNTDNLKIFPEKIQQDIERIKKRFEFTPDRKHKKITKFILDDFKKNNTNELKENIERAGSLRNFLG